MRRLRVLFPLLCALAVACAQLQPYATVPAAVPKGQLDAGTRVGICYDPLWDKTEKVQATAQAECEAGTVADKVDTDYKLAYCPTLLPARATFVCTPKK